METHRFQHNQQILVISANFLSILAWKSTKTPENFRFKVFKACSFTLNPQI